MSSVQQGPEKSFREINFFSLRYVSRSIFPFEVDYLDYFTLSCLNAPLVSCSLPPTHDISFSHGASSTNASKERPSAILLQSTSSPTAGTSGNSPDTFECETLSGRVSSGGRQAAEDNGVEEGKGLEGDMYEGVPDYDQEDENEVDQFRAIGGGWGLLWNQ